MTAMMMATMMLLMRRTSKGRGQKHAKDVVIDACSGSGRRCHPDRLPVGISSQSFAPVAS